LDEPGGGGQPQRGEQHAGEDVGRVMLAPVHAGGGDRDRHDDRRDQEQVTPPAPRVPDDQDRDGDVEARGRGHVPGRERRGGQARVEVRNGRPRALDDFLDDQEGAKLAEHDHGDEDDRAPAAGGGEEYDAGHHADDEDVLGG